MSKKQKKEKFQKQSGLLVGRQIPLVLIREDVDHKIHRIVLEILEGLTAIGIQLAVVKPTDEMARLDWHLAEKQYPKWIKMIDADLASKDIFDIAVIPDLKSQHWNALQLQRMVPLAERGVSTFDPIEEKGNGFLFRANPWSLFAALVRAQETYRFPYDWENLLKAVQQTAHSGIAS